MASTPVLILGTRLLAVEVMDLISDMPEYTVAGFVENMDRSLCETQLEGLPVYWIDEITPMVSTHVAVCALSTTHRKTYFEQAIAKGLRFQTLIHPTARVSSRARLGEGCFVSAMATIATHTTLGRGVFVNRGALIGHHTSIADYCTIQPGANVAGAITMGEQTYVGMGAVIIDKKKIGSGCIIAAGAVVVEDIPDHVQVMGVPGRITKSNIAPKWEANLMALSDKLIINAAITGMVPTKADNPHVPISPAEIAADAHRCVEAGASIVHLHARDDAGQPTYRAAIYREILQRVRDICPDVILCVSTSGRVHKLFEERSEVLSITEPAIRPEMASLTLGSMNFAREASVNPPDMIRLLAARMAEQHICPELELFDLGMAEYIHYLLRQNILMRPLYANILLGNLGTLGATQQNLALITRALPENTVWAATGIGRFQFDTNVHAIHAGGHVRVGLEDSLWMDAGKTDPATNPRLIQRLVDAARAVGRTPASPAEARAIIGLPARDF